MEKIRIQSGNVCDGEVEIHGYKHAMVQIISASVALNVPVAIMNAPLVDDTFILKGIIEKSGGAFKIEGRRLYIDPTGMKNCHIDPELSKKIHGSLYLIPAYAVRFGEVCFGEAGGCQIGSTENKGKRPVEHILSVLEQFGIETQYKDGFIIGKKITENKKVVVNIMEYSGSKERSTSPKISGATKTALLCAGSTKHTTILHPYLKTDVQDLMRFLKKCGYHISFSNTFIEVIAPPDLKMPTEYVEFHLTECVSEVMTYIALAVHTNISLTLKMSNIELVKRGLKLELEFLKKMGVELGCRNKEIIIGKDYSIQSIDIDVTNDSIQSDHHPFFALMLLKGDRRARIREFVWEDRFAYTKELEKLGAHFIQEGNTLYITPSQLLTGNQTLFASDTRAAAILILASLTAREPVEIQNIQHLHRGYENLLDMIESLGANFIREQEEALV